MYQIHSHWLLQLISLLFFSISNWFLKFFGSRWLLSFFFGLFKCLSQCWGRFRWMIYAIRHRAAHLNLLFEISSLCNERNNGTLAAAAAATATAAAAAATRTNSARQVKLGFPIRMPLTCAVETGPETETETAPEAGAEPERAEPSLRDSLKIDKDRQSRLPKSWVGGPGMVSLVSWVAIDVSGSSSTFFAHTYTIHGRHTGLYIYIYACVCARGKGVRV